MSGATKVAVAVNGPGSSCFPDCSATLMLSAKGNPASAKPISSQPPSAMALQTAAEKPSSCSQIARQRSNGSMSSRSSAKASRTSDCPIIYAALALGRPSDFAIRFR